MTNDAPPDRDSLTVRPNPASRLDTLVVFRDVPCGQGRAVTLQYIPDRHLLDPAAFRTYLVSMGARSWPGPEDQAVALLDDVGNEVVPRWAQVIVTWQTPDGSCHQAKAQEAQPGWRGPPPDLI